MKKLIAIQSPCRITAEAEGGIASGAIEMDAYNGGLMNLEGWDHPCVVDIGTISAAAEMIPCRVGHGAEETDVLGQIGIVVSDNAVSAAGRVTNRESEGPRAVLSMAKNGHQFQASIGGTPGRMVLVSAGQTIEMNGQTFEGPLYACYDTVLGEISVVSLGADSTTSARIAARAAKGKAIMAEEKKEPMEFSEFCKAAGFDPATLTDEQKTGMHDMHAKLCGESEDNPHEEAEEKDKKEKEEKAEAARRQNILNAAHKDAMNDAKIKAQVANTYKRIAAIKDRCGENADICAKALDGDWTDDKIDLEVLRASRCKNQTPAGHIVGKHVNLAKAIEARFLLAGFVNEDKIVKEFGEPNVVHAQHSLHGMGLCDLLRIAARMTGHDLPQDKFEIPQKLTEIAAKSNCPGFRERLRIEADGGATPMSLPGILSNVAHKLLMEGYNHVEQVWKAISKQGTLQDFKPHNRFRLTNDMRFRPLNTDGELRHGKLGEEAYIVQGDTQGIMFNLDRKVIINDDMSAFSDMPKAVGRGTGLAINNDFWTLWLSNPSISQSFKSDGTDGLSTTVNKFSFFSGSSTADASFDNQCTGTNTTSARGLATTSVLGVAGLQTAYAAALRQTDPAGYPIGMEPTILLVPATLRYTAESLMISRILVSQVVSGGTMQPSENPLAGKFAVHASAYLDNGNFSGNSALAWYLLLDPNAGFPCIEAAFLNGMQTPVVERAEANFENLGIRFRSWIDFGLAMEEPRGGVMMTGAA